MPATVHFKHLQPGMPVFVVHRPDGHELSLSSIDHSLIHFNAEDNLVEDFGLVYNLEELHPIALAFAQAYTSAAQALDSGRLTKTTSMRDYIVIHNHESGCTAYLVESEYPPTERQLVRELALDYEPYKGESLSIDLMCELATKKTLAPQQDDDQEYEEFPEAAVE